MSDTAPNCPAAPLSDADRSACAICADFLHTGRLWSGLALLASLVGVAALAAPGARLANMQAPAFAAALLGLGFAERYLAVRVGLDARLFGRLASGELPGLAALDIGLQGALNLDGTRGGRPLAPRMAGAKRLYRHQVTAVVGLILLAVVAWWPMA